MLFLASVRKPAACFGIYRWPWLLGNCADTGAEELQVGVGLRRGDSAEEPLTQMTTS